MGILSRPAVCSAVRQHGSIQVLGWIPTFVKPVACLARVKQRIAVSALPALLGICLLAHPPRGAADDLSGDLAMLSAFLDRDRSYSVAARQQAETEFELLRAKAADISPAAFQLAVAHIAALARNGHTLLMPGV
jgi:hypothetical protein